MTKFIVYGNPTGKARPRFTRSGHAYTDPKTRTYEALVRKSYKAINGIFYEKESLFIQITAFFGIPKSASEKERERMLTGEILPTKKPDIDNIIKIILDGMNGIAYNDDKQVCGLAVQKLYADEPRVEVEIFPMLKGDLHDTGKSKGFSEKTAENQKEDCNASTVQKQLPEPYQAD